MKKYIKVRYILCILAIITLVSIAYSLLVSASERTAANTKERVQSLFPYPSTPEAVIDTFYKASFNINEVAVVGDIGDVAERFQYTTEDFFSPGFDCFPITISYRIKKTVKAKSTAKITVGHKTIGELCLYEILRLNNNESEITYLIRKSKGIWKIDAPVHPPYISVETAIRLSEHGITVHPNMNIGIKRNIETLKKYLPEKAYGSK